MDGSHTAAAVATDPVAGPPPLLAVRGIEKRFPGVHALKGVDFDVRATDSSRDPTSAGGPRMGRVTAYGTPTARHGCLERRRATTWSAGVYSYRSASAGTMRLAWVAGIQVISRATPVVAASTRPMNAHGTTKSAPSGPTPSARNRL